MIGYRSEIDGLRAIAVLGVVFYHAGFSMFQGGFVGVDIFFVISGYIITRMMLAEMAAGTFSIGRFYERRARRILPALFVVLGCCIPFAALWMFPAQLAAFAKSVVATSSFAANIFFWREGGYFSAAAELKPLFHMWSLAIEEQFYLLFPPCLMLMHKLGQRSVFWAATGCAMISFALSEWALHSGALSDTTVFYLAPTRAWELLAGVICAAVPFGKAKRSSNLLGLLGLALILGAIFVPVESGALFPNRFALAPVTGAVLIILFADKQTWIARVLAAQPLAGIGLISYSAYLWHQPLFAFARLRSLLAPTDVVMLALCFLSFGLAYLSWRYVEQPVRQKTLRLTQSRRALGMGGVLLTVTFIGLGAFGIATDGAPWRLDARVLRYIAAENDKELGGCHFSRENPPPAQPVQNCLARNANGKIDVVFLGDSHSNAIAGMAQSTLLQAGIGSYRLSLSSCLPLAGFVEINPVLSAQCQDFIADVIRFARSEQVQTLVLTARFTFYWAGSRFDNAEGGVELGITGAVDLATEQPPEFSATDQPRRQRVMTGYQTALMTLAQEFNVVLVYPIPEAGWTVPELAAKTALFHGIDREISTSYDVYNSRNSAVITAFDQLRSDRIFRVKPDRFLCDQSTGRCANTQEGVALYYDDDHLSLSGAKMLAPEILRQVQNALERPPIGSP